MNELDSVPADHLVRPIAQDGLGAGADLDQRPVGIADQDQILRRLEDAPPLFECCGLGVGFVNGARKGPRQHAGLSAGVDRNWDRVRPADALHCRGQLMDRPSQRSCDDHCKYGGA